MLASTKKSKAKVTLKPVDLDMDSSSEIKKSTTGNKKHAGKATAKGGNK